MAWQSSGAMAGGGGLAGAGIDGSANVGTHPQGTEYTLQGSSCIDSVRCSDTSCM
jgi:hypothetical protein